MGRATTVCQRSDRSFSNSSYGRWGGNGITSTIQMISEKSVQAELTCVTNGKQEILFTLLNFRYLRVMPFNQQGPLIQGNNKETNLQQRGPRSMLCPQTQCLSDAETLRQTLAPGTSQSTPAMSPALENHC